MRGEDFTAELQVAGCYVTRLWWNRGVAGQPSSYQGRYAEPYGYKVGRQFGTGDAPFMTVTTVSEQLVSCVGPEDEGALIRTVLEILKQQFLRRDTSYHTVPAEWDNRTGRYTVPDRSEGPVLVARYS